MPKTELDNPIDFPAEVFAAVVSALAEGPYELYGHSNAATIVASTAHKVLRRSAMVRAVWLVNPLGIPPCPNGDASCPLSIVWHAHAHDAWGVQCTDGAGDAARIHVHAHATEKKVSSVL